MCLLLHVSLTSCLFLLSLADCVSWCDLGVEYLLLTDNCPSAFCCSFVFRLISAFSSLATLENLNTERRSSITKFGLRLYYNCLLDGSFISSLLSRRILLLRSVFKKGYIYCYIITSPYFYILRDR